jgi:D-3-phosphoglycerate dehydrogenase
VDETALAEALEAGRIAGAALDVFAVEPLPDDSPLRRAPNLVLSPHLGASTVEAQELVAREIAVAVRCALVEGDMSRAINAPSVGGEALRRLRPLFDLGLRVGRLACSLAPSRMEAVEIRYAGALAEVLPPLRAHVLTGILGTILGHDQVNFVNAPHLAETRDLEVTSTQLPRRTDYAEFVEVAVRSEQGCVCVAGALLGDQHPRIVRIDDYHVDVTPRGSLLVLRNRDVPGVIGAVGTLLGSMGLNIAEYHQARLTAGGASLATVAVDGRVDRTLAGSLMELAEVERAWVVDLG